MSKLILSDAVINWYEKNHRKLPWRSELEEHGNPYFVLVSEFMLQQTLVKTVIPYFNRFISKYNNIFILANTDLNAVLSEWSGLGYYMRAKNLHETSKIICTKYNGIIPKDYDDLISLPGIGDYTASAIMSIAFNYPSNVVDGNIERIFSRLNKIDLPINKAKKKIRTIAKQYVPKSKVSFYVQGLMDIGATICKPKICKCFECPLETWCLVSNKSESINYPIKEKKIKRIRKGTFYCFIKNNNSILLIKNENKGLFANMDVLPSFGWENDKNFGDKKFKNLKVYYLPNKFYHTFTHFKLEVNIVICKNFSKIELNEMNEIEFVKFVDLEKKAIPSLMKKILNKVQNSLNI